MKHNALQAIRAAEKLLAERKIKYVLIHPPHFEEGFRGRGNAVPTNVWIVPYIYIFFQDESSFIYLNDVDLSFNHILSKHGSF